MEQGFRFVEGWGLWEWAARGRATEGRGVRKERIRVEGARTPLIHSGQISLPS